MKIYELFSLDVCTLVRTLAHGKLRWLSCPLGRTVISLSGLRRASRCSGTYLCCELDIVCVNGQIDGRSVAADVENRIIIFHADIRTPLDLH
jgi:hypothetical protein